MSWEGPGYSVFGRLGVSDQDMNLRHHHGLAEFAENLAVITCHAFYPVLEPYVSEPIVPELLHVEVPQSKKYCNEKGLV